MKKTKYKPYRVYIRNENWNSGVTLFVNWESEDLIKYLERCICKDEAKKDKEGVYQSIRDNNMGVSFTTRSNDEHISHGIYMRHFEWSLKHIGILSHEFIHFTHAMLEQKGTERFDSETFAYAFEHMFYQALRKLGKVYGNRKE